MVLNMRHVLASIIAVTLVGGAMLTAQDSKPPEKLVFSRRAATRSSLTRRT